MLKATKFTFAAALLLGSCGLAMAQAGAAAGAGTDKTPGSESGKGRLPLLQSPQATSAPEANKLQQRKVNLRTRHKQTRSQVK